eukprot:2807776-Lingulodinium_polyedra.AAC.1
MDWDLHTSRSRPWANAAELRRWLKAAGGGVPASACFKGFGALASAGPARRSPVTAERVQAAVGRFARLARLPVPFKARCHMGAAAGTAAGLYGA